ncbi:MAG: zinc-ribbon domain-containing protein, partial [Acidobacteriota bacterium]
YDEVSAGLAGRLQEDLAPFGLELSRIYINSITPPPEVQKAIDDKSRLGLFDDLNRLMKMKAAMAFEKASENQGEAGSGMGMGLGVMMPAMIAEAMRNPEPNRSEPSAKCAACGHSVSGDSKFCPHCGRNLANFECSKCGTRLPADAKFCTQCGKMVEPQNGVKKCSRCGAENASTSSYCGQCGERIQ